MLNLAFMKTISKRFLRTLVGGQGLRNDAMYYIRRHIPLRPLVNRREPRAAVGTVGFIPNAMEHVVPPVPNTMFMDHVRAPPEDGVPGIRARDAVGVDALLDGPVLDVLSEELPAFYLIDSDGSRGGVAMQGPLRIAQFDVYAPAIGVHQLAGLCRARLCPTLRFKGYYHCFLLL